MRYHALADPAVVGATTMLMVQNWSLTLAKLEAFKRQ
jgi:hypothetical protein